MSPRLETQFGMLGVTDIQPKVTDASSHLIFTTMYVAVTISAILLPIWWLDTNKPSFCAPENIFLSDLQDVWLGEGIHTIVEMLY